MECLRFAIKAGRFEAADCRRVDQPAWLRAGMLIKKTSHKTMKHKTVNRFVFVVIEANWPILIQRK
jgi:hypothetical protein